MEENQKKKYLISIDQVSIFNPLINPILGNNLHPSFNCRSSTNNISY